MIRQLQGRTPVIQIDVFDTGTDLEPSSEEAESQNRAYSYIMRGVSSWMVSTIIHLSLILVLAVVTLGAAGRQTLSLVVTDVPTQELVSFDVLIQASETDSLETELADMDDESFEKLDVSPDTITDALQDFVPDSLTESFESISGTGIEEKMARSGDGDSLGGAEFFGITGSGSRFVFVVDCSGSMAEYRRWNRAKRELMKSISRLSEKQEFLILLYNSQSVAMNDTPPALVSATKSNQDRAFRWLRKQQPATATYAATAMNKAFQLKPDSIFLLSDGEFDDQIQVFDVLNDHNGSMKKRKKRDRYVKDAKPQRMTPVHTISLGGNRGSKTMELIADNNNGIYTLIGD